jgi:hypothetical protein
LNDAVDSSISRAEIEATISRLLEIQAAVDFSTAEEVPRFPRTKRGIHTRPDASLSQLDPEPHFTGVSAAKEDGSQIWEIIWVRQ